MKKILWKELNTGIKINQIRTITNQAHAIGILLVDMRNMCGRTKTFHFFDELCGNH
jgi:hypothetical protein